MKKGEASLLQAQIQNNKRLGIIIDRILEYHGKTREAVAEYCKTAIEEGFTGLEAWDYLCLKLKDKVAKSTLYDWGNKYLPEGSMKVTKPNGSTIKIPVSESSKSERSLLQKQLEQKQQQEEGRPGYLNEEHECYKDIELEALRKKQHDERPRKYFEERKAVWETLPKPENPNTIFIADKWGVDDFEIEKLNTYPLAYSKKVIMHMDDCFKLHEKDTWGWQRTQDKLVRENKALKAENAELKKKLGV